MYACMDGCMYVCMQRPRHMTHMIIASGCKMMTFGTLAELFREECLSEATTTSSGRGLELEFGDDWSCSAVILDWGRSFLVSGLEGVIFLFFAVFIYSYYHFFALIYGYYEVFLEGWDGCSWLFESLSKMVGRESFTFGPLLWGLSNVFRGGSRRYSNCLWVKQCHKPPHFWWFNLYHL